MFIDYYWGSVGVACLAGAAWTLGWQWHDHQQKRIADCPGHSWYFVSLYNLGNEWNRKCQNCPFSEISHEGPKKGDLVKMGKDWFHLQ